MSAYRAAVHPRRMLIVLLATVLLLLPGLALAGAATAQSASRLSVTSSAGANTASASGPTSVTVSGSGFQSIKNAFGGIYVVFGYAKSSNWQPSKGGTSGKDFFYVADSQSKNNKGYQRFVAFPGSSTADSANGGVINANGSFRLSMVIPGPTFTAATSSGGSTTIDCREVTCGIFTFGAHGVVNGKNESFVPISFGPAAATQQTPATQAPQQDKAGGNATTSAPGASAPQVQQDAAPQGQEPAQNQTSETGSTANEAAAPGEATLGLEQQTVIAGRTLGFTGRGFAAGEQVVATLSAGLTAAGPVTAGQFGEVAGAVQIPADTVPGTHKIKLTGAGSGNSVEAEFSVMADSAALAAPQDDSQGIRWALIAVLVAAALLFIVVLSSLIAALRQRNGKKRRTSSAAAKRPSATKHKRRAKARGRTSRSPRKSEAAQPSSGVPQATEPATSALDQLDEAMKRERV